MGAQSTLAAFVLIVNLFFLLSPPTAMPSLRCKDKTHKGFTLIELMVTTIVLGIGLAVAVPALSQMVARNRVTAASHQLLMDLTAARSEAVRTGRATEVCASQDGMTCAAQASTWQIGWVVREASGSTVIALHQPTGGLIASTSVVAFRFMPTGEVQASSGRLTAHTTITLSNDNASSSIRIAPYGHIAIQ